MTHRQEDQREDQTVPKASWMDALTVVPALVSIVLASVGMVHAAVALADRWGVPDHITGMFVLATLTGIPNVLAAVRLARRRRGAAVVSEVLNSNALNVLSGICGPALVIGLGTISARTSFAAWWLVGMTALVVILAAARRGLGRSGGAGLIALYAVFIGSSLFWP